MEPRQTDNLKTLFFVIILLSTGSCENDLFLNFCGTWRHGSGPLNLNVHLSTGCNGISISANESSLSIHGQITAQCRRFDVIPLKKFGLAEEEDSRFCLYWEPLLDQLTLQVAKQNLTLCHPASLKDSCCTDLSHGANTAEAKYGIMNGVVRDDFLTDKILTAYNFNGSSTNCRQLCNQANWGSNNKNRFEDSGRSLDYNCGDSAVLKLTDDARGHNVTRPATPGVSSESTISIYLPPALKQATMAGRDKPSTVTCTFFQSYSLFQEGQKIFNDVVEITVENEVIADLPEPIRISFHHDVIPKSHTRKCVSWDTMKDPLQVNWLMDGCETRQIGEKHTECLCNHLTYFTVLVELEPRPVPHLLALTVITYLGCAASAFSCVALIVFLFRKRKRSNEQSTPIHLGLAVSLCFLSLLFFFNGTIANVGGESVCVWVGAILHYALLCSLTWMGVEVFNTFWLVYMVFNPSPKPYIWNLVGFVLPAVPVAILAGIGGIYGLREVVSSDDISNPYQMCWMKLSHEAKLAHYFTTMTILAILVLSGFVMLFLVYRQIRPREEWKQNRVAFFSIWGLSCLFGTTWGLTFFNFEPISVFILFLTCILNSFQGFFLMLRFFLLDWMRKETTRSPLGSTSSGSTRQHMLQNQEKS